MDMPPTKSPIRIDCKLPGFENCFILFKGSGWKYRHLREWETTNGAEGIARVVAERIESWNISIDGENIPFEPLVDHTYRKDGKDVVEKIANPAVFDELPPGISDWVIVSFRAAYSKAGLPSPN